MGYRAKFLGKPEFFIDGEQYVFPFQKARVLMFLLAEEKSISKDKICELLWPDKPIEKGRRNLSNALSCLRPIIPISTAGGSIALDPSVVIERDIDMLRGIDNMEWAEIDGLSLPFMDLQEIEEWDFFSDWVLPKRQYYHNMLVENLKKRAERFASSSGDYCADIVACYEKLAKYEPYDEKIHGELVRLYIKTGQKVKAVDTARSYSCRIESDFGIRPDMSEISYLMDRKAAGSNPLAVNYDFNDIPLARNTEVLNMLDFLLRTGAESNSSCGFVWGEQGIGKTAFISEVVSCLTERGWECYFVRCSQEEKDRPMAPFIQLLQRLKYTPAHFENITSLSELNYSRIAEIVYECVAEISENQHRLLIIENIQWMDNASWIILETIMWNHSVPRHLLVSGFENIRSAFMVRTTLAEEPFEKFEVTLKRFNLEETGQICRGIYPNQEWPDEQIHEIYIQTEGNPFFIKELLLLKDSARQESESAPRNPFLPMVELLDKGDRLFLDAIAVSQEPASMRRIAETIGVSPLQISEIYDNIKIHGFLRENRDEGGDVLYFFTHAKIREALLKDMSDTRKQALHIKNIEILEAMQVPHLYRYRNIYSRLFYHSREAGLKEKELLWRVGELKLHFRAAHEVFPALVDKDLLHYIPSVEDINYTRQALTDIWRLMDKVFRTSERTPLLAGIERDMYILKGAYLWWEGEYEDSRQILGEGMRKAVRIGEPEAVVEAAVQMCYLAIQTDDARLLSACAANAYRLSKKEHMHQWVGASLRFMAICDILEGRHTEAEKLLQMSTRVFEKLEEEGESYTVCLIAAEHFRGDAKLAAGDVRAALSFYISCINIGESVGLYLGLGLSLAKAAFCHMLLGNFKDAEGYLIRMEKFYSLIHFDWEGGLQGGGIAFSLMGLLECKNGEWDKGKFYFDLAQKLVDTTMRPTWQAVMYWAKLRLMQISGGIPDGFKEEVLNQTQDWYLAKLEKMRHQLGWIQSFQSSESSAEK